MSMTPCGWESLECSGECADRLAALPAATADMLRAFAAHFLWSATGRRFGLCETTYRPCRRQCADFGGVTTPARIGGQWVNLACGECVTQRCSCDAVDELIIPDVESVVSLTIDGVALVPATDVAVYDRRVLVRTDGAQWPACQDIRLPGSAVGAWQITVRKGTPIPAGHEYVTGVLVCELAKACAGDAGCRLPQRVQTVTRQGVTIGFQDNFDALSSDLKTGLFEVDAWVAMARNARFGDPAVRNPLRPRPPVQTWPV